MANATHARSSQAASPSTPPVATYPLTPSGKPFRAPKTLASLPRAIDSRKAHAVAHDKRQEWAEMNLRQEWADAAFMRGHLRVAGLRVKCNTEPATVPRIKAKLRSIGVASPEIQEAIGMPLARWLKVNPRLPLWSALALVLESVGRFTPSGGDTQSPEPVAIPEPVPLIRVAMPTHRRPFVVTMGGQE